MDKTTLLSAALILCLVSLLALEVSCSNLVPKGYERQVVDLDDDPWPINGRIPGRWRSGSRDMNEDEDDDNEDDEDDDDDNSAYEKGRYEDDDDDDDDDETEVEDREDDDQESFKGHDYFEDDGDEGWSPAKRYIFQERDY